VRVAPGRAVVVATAVAVASLTAGCGDPDTETEAGRGSGGEAPASTAGATSANGEGRSSTTEAGDASGTTWDAEYVGAVAEVADNGGRIITNYGELEDGGEGITGTISFTAEGQIGLEGAAEIGQIACLQLEIELPPDAVIAPDGPGEQTVTVPTKVDFQYRACPPSVTVDAVDEEVDLDFGDDGGFTGSFLYNETLVEFTATPT
jgi:hypothetical protein